MDVIGTYTIRENYEFARRWMADPAIPDPILVCRDSRRLDGSQQAQDMHLLAGLFKRIVAEHDIPPESRMAVVSPQDLQFGLSRIFGALAEDATVPVDVFRNTPEAVAWLKQ